MAQSPLRTPSLLGYGKGAPSLLGYGKPAPTWTQAELDAASIERARSSRTSDPITQAWQSAGEGIAAGDLNEAALAAQQEGDNVRAQDLLRRAGVAQERAKVLANDTPGFTEIDGVGSAANWLGGAVGSMGRSAAPAVGAGLVGAGAGALVAGPAGAAAGGLRGFVGGLLRYAPAAAVSYDQLRGENVTQQFADPEVASRPADERARNASLTAAAQTIPEMFLPQRAVAAVTNRIANNPAARRLVREAVDAGGEGFTETVQQEMGYQGLQATGSTAERNPDDYVNAFTAGVAGGAGISTVSNAAGYGLDKLLPNATQPAPVPPPADPNAPAIPTVEELATNSAKSVAKTVTDLVEDPIMFGARALNRDKVDAIDLKGVKDPEAMAAAIAARDAQGAENAGMAAQAILDQDRFTAGEKRRIVAMNGNYADPANQTAIIATLGFSRLREIGGAFMEQGQKWLGKISDMLGKTTKNNLQNFDTSPMVDALAPIFEERAPAAADFFLKMSQAMENPDAKVPPEMEKHLVYIADQMAGNEQHNTLFLDALKATGGTALAKRIEHLQNVPGASRDVSTKTNSLFDQLFDDTNTRYTRSKAARLVDKISLQFGTASKAEQKQAIDALTPVFGSEERAKAVIDHYGKMRTEYFKETTDKLPEDDQNTRGIGNVKGTLAALANGDLREEDLKGMTAGYRASNPSRPFFAAEDTKDLEEAVAAGGPDARAAGMDEYIKLTEQSPAEAYGRIRRDLEKRLRGSRNKDKGWLTAQLEKAVAEGADLKTRQDLEKKIASADEKRSDLPRLEAEWAKLEEASPSAEDANENRFDKALSLYKVAMRGADNTLATDEDIHRFGRMLRVARNIKPPKKPEKPEGNDPLDERVYREQMADYAEKADAYRKKMEDIKRTEIHFRKKNGDILKLSAESMIYASPVHGSDLKRLLASVAMVRARPEIVGIENFSVDTLAIREGEKRKAKTIGELRGVKKERKTQRATDLVDATKLQADARVKRVAKRADATKVERADKRAKQAAAKVERDAMDNMNRDHYRRQFAVDTVKDAGGTRDVARPIAPPTEERAAAELPAVEKKLEETAAEIDVVKTERKIAFNLAKNAKNLTWKEFADSPVGLHYAEELASLKAALSLGRSQQRVLTEFVIEGLEKTFPLPNKNEFTHDLADDVLMEGGFDENRLTEAYLEEKIGVLYERLAAVLTGVSMQNVQQLEKHRKRLETETNEGEITDILNSIDLILEDAGDVSMRVVERIQKEITETENDLDDMLEEGAHHPEQLPRHRMKDNPTRFFQNEENFFYVRRMLATAIAQAEHNRALIPGVKEDLQDKLDKLRAKTSKGRNASASEAEYIRTYQLALARLRRVESKRPEDAPVSYSVAKGKHLTKPLDPGVTYNNQQEQSTEIDFDDAPPEIGAYVHAAERGTDNPTQRRKEDPKFKNRQTVDAARAEEMIAREKSRGANNLLEDDRLKAGSKDGAGIMKSIPDIANAPPKPTTPKERHEQAVAGRRMDAVRAFLEEINHELASDTRLKGVAVSAEGGKLADRPPAEVVRIDSPVQKLSDKELVDRSVVAALALLRLRQSPKLDVKWGPRASQIARAAMAARAEAAVKVSEEYGKLRDERDARDAKQAKQVTVTKTTAKPAMPLALKQTPRGGVKTNAPPLASATPKDAMSTADTTDVKKAKLYVKLAKRQQAALDKVAQAKAVNVWAGSGENAALSNLASRPFTYQDRKYLSVEHAYQSLKSGQFDQVTYDKYSKAGQKIPGQLGTKKEDNWNLRLMKKLMAVSFEQNPTAAEALLATGDAPITHTQDRGIWRTEFPRALMAVRDHLKKAPAAKEAPKGQVLTTRRYTREEIRANPDKIYVFGDNVARSGLGGQAAAARGEPNTIGIPTKYAPTMQASAFFGRDLAKEKAFVDAAFDKIEAALAAGKSVVFPADGVGTGRALLKEKAPELAAHIEARMARLKPTTTTKQNAQTPMSDADYDQKMTEFAEQARAVWSDMQDASLAQKQAKTSKDIWKFGKIYEKLEVKYRDILKEQDEFVLANTLPIPQSFTDELTRVRGAAVKLAFVRGFMGGSGSYTRKTLNGVVERSIKLAATAPIGVLYHEMLHDFFAEIGKTKPLRQLKADLLRAAERPFVVKQLEQLLAGHPAALQQLKDPEERLAYAYQFWAEGQLRLTQDGEGLFKRIAKFLRETLNILTLDEKLERTLIELHSGRLTTPSDVQTALAKLETLSDKIDRKMPAVHRTFHRLFDAAVDQLHAMNSPSISKLADMFYKNTDQSGFLVKKAEAEGAWRNKYHNIVKKYSPQEVKDALVNLQSMKPARGAGLERELRGFFQEIHEYMLGKDVKRRVELPYTGPGTGGYTYEDFEPIRNYFPRIWDPQALVKHKDEFITKLMQHGGMGRREAEQTYDGILADSKKRDPAGGGITPFAASTISRSLKFIDERTSHDFTKYQLQDMNEVMDSYIRQSTHRAEYASLFGNSGEVIDDLLNQANDEIAKTGNHRPEIDRARVIISALDGTMNDIMDPKYKNIMAGVLTLQNWVLLPLAVFSQLIDPLGIAVRTGDIRDAGAAYMRVLTDLERWVKGKVDDVKEKLGKPVTRKVIQDRHRDMAHILGAVQRDASFDSINHAFGSMYMSKGLRNANTLLFRANGMQGINDSFRTAAVVAGERYILEHREDARRMEELGLKASDVVETSPGVLDIDSPKMKEAMFRFVDGAIVRPNAAHRAVWMSDPRFMLVTHLKQFAFSFQKVVLERVTHELKNNNSAPLMMLAAYAPVMLAADMAKWIMFGNYPEHWTAMDFFGHAINRSGLLGKFSFGTDVYGDFTHGEIPGTSFLGPTADHLALLSSWLTGGAETSDVIQRSVPLARLLPM